MGENMEFFGAVLLFMAATVVAFIWGLKREEDPEKSLQHKLLNATGAKVEKYLKKNPYITTEGIEKLIRGVTVRDPWFRKVMRIDDAKLYAKGLIRYLLDKQVIEYAGKNGYCLKKQAEENK